MPPPIPSFQRCLSVCACACSWVSVLQNSKEEALNTALGGDQLHLQDSGLQELSRAIIAELRHMPGNEACADCGAPGQELQTWRWEKNNTQKKVTRFPAKNTQTLFFLFFFFLSPAHLRSNMAVDKSWHPHLHRVLRYPQGAGRPLLQDPVPHPGLSQHLGAPGNSQKVDKKYG